jgi:O-methyltransferase domain
LAAAAERCCGCSSTGGPGLHGIVFDLPEARRNEAQLGEGISFVAGSFFDSVPSADAYVLSKILHDWNDEQAAKILQTIHRSAPRAARLFVMDSVVPAGNDPSAVKWLDLLMLALQHGRERNEDEWRALLDSADFAPGAIEDGLVQATCR